MRYTILTILLCFFTFITKAQNINPYRLTDRQVDSLHAVLVRTRNDSLKMEIDAIFSICYSENKIDSAIYFLNQQLALAKELNIPLWQGEALSYLGYLYVGNRDYVKSLQFLSAASEIANDKASERNGYSPKFITGIPAWFTSRQCLLSIIYSNTGYLYNATGSNDKATSAFDEAIRIAKQIGDRESLWTYYIQLSGNYWDKDKTDSALFLLQRALAISRTVKWKYYTASVYLSLGKMYREAGDTSAAHSYLWQSVLISHQQQNLALEGQCYKSLTRYFLDIHQPDSIIFYIRKAQVIFKKLKDDNMIGVTYDFLSRAYRMKGNLDSAYAYLLIARSINDSIIDVERTQAHQYQVASFNEQIHRQEQENERERQQSRLITYITLAGLGTTFLILFLLYRNNRQKQKTNRALTVVRDLQDQKISLLDEAVKQRTDQLNNMRQIMASDFHDETGNILSVITQQASLLKLQVGDNDAVLPIAESIIQNSNDLYTRSRDFLWNLNHNSDDPTELFHYLTAYGQLFYNQFDVDFSSVIKSEVQPLLQLNTFAAVNLIFIFKEVMTNVVKHAGASEVVFEMEYKDSKVVYTLQDNGRWKQKDDLQSHYGLNNMQRRCEKNKFGFLLLRQEQGTRIEITVPVVLHLV